MGGKLLNPNGEMIKANLWLWELRGLSHHPSLVQCNEKLNEFACILRAPSVPN